VSIFDKAKEMAEELVDKVKDKLDGDREETEAAAPETGATPSESSSETPSKDSPKTIPHDGAVTPADVAETVSDPDLQHPGPPSDEQDR
jgi:hypothetical protein